MTATPLDPFSQKFDSIEVDPKHTPTREAIEYAMANAAPEAPSEPPAPGFYLLNDANGRFAIDRDMGVVTVADESILQTERNAVHTARLRVVEPSGATYELDMQLRITGRVPQMIGAEEFAAIAGLTDETILVAPRVPQLVVAKDEAKTRAEFAPTAWTHFAVAQGHQSRTPRQQPRRSFIVADLPQTGEHISFEFEGLPRAFSAHLPWSL
ncbi:MAG: hypothetical protein R3C31_10655 [Hyphomonadaceae bacterium]